VPLPVERPKPIDPKSGEPIDTTPVDLDDYEGSYTNVAHPGETFGLKIDEDDPHLGHTHHLKSVDHYWSGTEQEFKEAFEKK
jgi:hypothetical protein